MASTSNAYDFDLFDSRDHGSAAPKLPEPKAPQKQKQKNNVVKLDEKKAANKIRRWQAIAESAAKQSKRSMIPQIHPVMSYRDALQYAKTCEINLVPYENERGMKATKEALDAIEPGKSVSVIIGPEGGFSEEEIAAARASMEVISLGKRILRTDTAGICVMSLVMSAIEMKEMQE